MPLERKVALTIALYEAVPDKPSDEARWADFQAHLRLKALLDEASDVRPR